MSTPVRSVSAVFIEAPSLCDERGRCLQEDLADFETTRFGGAKATTASGHVGTITDPSWTSTAIRLGSDVVPTAPSRGGTTFSVSPAGP